MSTPLLRRPLRYARSHPRTVVMMVAAAFSGPVLVGGKDAAPERAIGSSGPILSAGPNDSSVIGSPELPHSPRCGANGPVIWLRVAQRPAAAPIALFQSAGIPVCVVTKSTQAFRHPLVLSWPYTRFTKKQRLQVLSYVQRGGLFLAVAPTLRARGLIGLGGFRGGYFKRLENVPELGYVGSSRLRDRQILALRRFWSSHLGGFRLGDAPDGRKAAIVILHDVRNPKALRRALVTAKREHASGVRATYVIEPKQFADSRGGSLAADETELATLKATLKVIVGTGSTIASGGLVGGPLQHASLGTGIESYPSYSPSYVGPSAPASDTVFGELRVSRHELGDLVGTLPSAFRGEGGRTGHHFAAALEASGYFADATLTRNAAGGAFPFLQSEHGGGVRSVLRFPVSFESLPQERRLGAFEQAIRANVKIGAPTVVAINLNGSSDTLRDELRIVRAHKLWVGSLDELSGFLRTRSTIGIDAQPLDAADMVWQIKLSSDAKVVGQSIVSPFKLARATDQKNRRLRIVDRNRVVIPTFTGKLKIELVRAPLKAVPYHQKRLKKAHPAPWKSGRL